MKKKNQKMKVLREELIKYSKQIGILDIEIPELVFYGEEFSEGANEIYRRHGIRGGRQKYGGRYTTTLGLFDKYRRIIFVNIRGKEQTIRELRETLIHELVHYRFRHLPYNSKEHAKRIKLILRGKQYPRTHLPYPVVPFK